MRTLYPAVAGSGHAALGVTQMLQIWQAIESQTRLRRILEETGGDVCAAGQAMLRGGDPDMAMQLLQRCAATRQAEMQRRQLEINQNRLDLEERALMLRENRAPEPPDLTREERLMTAFAADIGKPLADWGMNEFERYQQWADGLTEKSDPEKPPALGSVEDLILRTCGPDPTPECILAGISSHGAAGRRKIGEEADDDAPTTGRVAQGILEEARQQHMDGPLDEAVYEQLRALVESGDLSPADMAIARMILAGRPVPGAGDAAPAEPEGGGLLGWLGGLFGGGGGSAPPPSEAPSRDSYELNRRLQHYQGIRGTGPGAARPPALMMPGDR